jgi:hypothetical protein
LSDEVIDVALVIQKSGRDDVELMAAVAGSP